MMNCLRKYGCFKLKFGKIIDLKIDFEKILKDIQKIYNLTNSDWMMSRKR
jgi:carbonic anhydrase